MAYCPVFMELLLSCLSRVPWIEVEVNVSHLLNTPWSLYSIPRLCVCVIHSSSRDLDTAISLIVCSFSLFVWYSIGRT